MAGGEVTQVSRLMGRFVLSLAGVAAVTAVARTLAPVNATTAGFGFLLLVLVVAGAWGFVEAVFTAVAATLAYNFFFFSPIGAFTIDDPENWIALFSFLATAVMGSRLSAIARRRALEAIARQQDIERLYTFSRGILAIDDAEPFPQQLVRKLAGTFELREATLYDRITGEFYRVAPEAWEGADEQLREAAVTGKAFRSADGRRQVTAIRLGAEPVASLATAGQQMPDFVAQGIANLVAIGLERARAQDLENQMEAARHSEQLRTTLIDAMAHELKTPLTSIKAATTSLLTATRQTEEGRQEMLKIADEEADRLRELIDDAIELARLDTATIAVAREIADVPETVRDVIAALSAEIDTRPVGLEAEEALPRTGFDRRLVKLAVKQLLDNALKYSPPESPVAIRIAREKEGIAIEIQNSGKAIPAVEQARIFDRFYRSPAVRHQVPGSGLGLSIAQRIAQAHQGALTVTSRPDQTIFRLTLPLFAEEAHG
jgi:two-component system, OmpR family, sensor histidine kinase KdpD